MRRLLLIIILALLPVMAHSATYTVSTQGSDNNPGTAQSPWKTIQKAANTAVAGDTVLVQPGLYLERVTFPNSGTPGNPITFQGTLGNEGSWDTIIDGSTSTSGWITAPEVGPGVWKATLGSPQALISNGKTIWKISDRAMDGEVLQGTDGTGFQYLARSATAQINTVWGPVVFWDGIEALFGKRNGTTYLRFRNGNNPASMNVRYAPSGGVFRVLNKNYITLKNFKVVGGEFAVEITGGSQSTVVENNYLANGKNRIAFWNGGGKNTIIHNNKITLDMLGHVNFPPGARNNSSYARIVNLHTYFQNKFLIGETEINDASIRIANSSNVTISENEIYNGMMGIVFYSTTNDTLIANNTFHNFSDIGIYINSDYASTTITGNLFYDSAHHLRLEATSRTMDVYIYANRFHNVWYSPGGSGAKHVFIAPPGLSPPAHSPSNIWVYHNSFAGGGWAVDMGGVGEFDFDFPSLHVLNNLISTNGISSGGTRPIGELASNYSDKLWYSNTIPDFVLPTGHGALGSGIDLISRRLPGMTTTYYKTGRPDMGAIQGTSQSTVPAPTRLRAMTK